MSLSNKTGLCKVGILTTGLKFRRVLYLVCFVTSVEYLPTRGKKSKLKALLPLWELMNNTLPLATKSILQWLVSSFT